MKTTIKSIGFLWILTATMLFLASCDKEDDVVQTDPTPEPFEKSIVATAQSDDQFSILVEALVMTDLVSALEGNGPYTVFAPTNDAFENLFMKLGISSVNDLSKETLTPILLYHVVSGKAMAADLSTGYISTISAAGNDNGIMIYAEVGSKVMLNGNSSVVIADIGASNGVIHVIDEVLLPPTVVGLAQTNGDFSILVEAVVKAGLAEALSGDGSFTVFAPTNAAFESLFATLQVGGISDLTAEALTPILLYHVVSGNVLSTQLSSGMVNTLNEEAKIDVMIDNKGVMLDGNTMVVAADIQGSNGVVHVIDKVLLP